MLVSLGRAREKGQNAKIQASLVNAMAQAEIFYSEQGSYKDKNNKSICETSKADDGIQEFLESAIDASPNSSLQATAVCAVSSDGNAWAAAVEMHSFFCVDSLGTAQKYDNNCRINVSFTSCADRCQIIRDTEVYVPKY